MSIQRILIVDDDVSVGTVVKAALEDCYDIGVTTSAMTAYKYLDDHKVGLVLLDINMPNINGITALEEIRRNHPETIVIMVTACASEDNIHQATSLGAKGIISKPFEIDELIEYVNQTISQKSMREC